MTMSRTGLVAGVAAAVVLAGATRWTLRAQDGRPAPKKVAPPAPGKAAPLATVKAAPAPIGKAAPPTSTGYEGASTIQEALLRPFAWPFREETTLQDAAAYLGRALGGQVVFDRAALTRRKLTPEATVRLELGGVRLKTGLKLLLDQVGLTYRVVPEDNLLILTDAEGADDPSERILAEIKALRRDLRDLRGAVDDLREDLAPESESGPALRKPTIIEELPEGDGKGMPEAPPAHSRPGL